MWNNKSENKKKFILLLFLISFIFSFPINTFSSLYKNTEIELEISTSPEINLSNKIFKRDSISRWKEQIIKVDQNENGLHDELETILTELDIFELSNKVNLKSKKNSNNGAKFDNIFKVKSQSVENIQLDNVPIIVCFPEGDYHSISLLFKSLGGTIKSNYKAAINGFAGSISKSGLYEFRDTLELYDIPFFIEEDKVYQAQLYYTGRNMNLRPYVWNTLSYEGDKYSSTAIIDTGVDDSHNFLSPGYSDGDFNYKIVGWRDEINGLTLPYDDNGHGSHCSGIASGNGNPSYDINGRSVATAAYNLDYTGYIFSPGIYIFNWSRFNVTDPGDIELFCEFEDFTPGPDDVDFWAYLYYGNTVVDSYEVNFDSWSQTLSYTATSTDLGMYSFRFILNLIDTSGDGYVSDFNITFRSEIHWPFDPPQYGGGDPWKGVAPESRIVGVKILDQYGSGYSSDIINGINWVLNNKLSYNITTASLSLGGGAGDILLINAVNNLVENGIVTVVSAGNDGSGFNNIGSPGDADNVITVAAMSVDDQITDYSSQGGLSYTGNTIKPDIAAPGGSFNNLQMFSTDTNDNDAEGAYSSDGYNNDMEGAQGTSMSCPAVAGAVNLLIEAMGGHQIWNYSSNEAKEVKALLLMTATETYPLQREIDVSYSPTLDRGGKDFHEGYGRLNIDMAIEAYTNHLTPGSYKNAWVTSSLLDPINKHGIGCYVNLIKGGIYNFTLDVPGGADFDLYLYNKIPTSIGEPIIIASSTSTGLGQDEEIIYTALESGGYYLIAKAISGEGIATISHNAYSHELIVLVDSPENLELGMNSMIKTIVINNGLFDEFNVEFNFSVDKKLVSSISIPQLPVGGIETINYPLTPTKLKTYNFTAYAYPVPGESYLINNIDTKIISVYNNFTLFYDDFENGLSKWESVTGLWHLTDSNSINPDPYNSPTHGMWFGNESTGTYNYGLRKRGNFTSNPFDLSNCLNAYLEFYHWRETEEWNGYDMSYVYISTDGLNWNPVYVDFLDVMNWEKVVVNISDYVGNKSVQIMFHFDTWDDIANDYIGWTVDDIKIFTNQYVEFIPELTNGSVDPVKGYQSSVLNFSVAYTDKDNNDPSYVYVVINGSTYSMGKQNPMDVNYTDGCLYQYLTYLQSSPYNYSYYFECSDGKFWNSTVNYNNLQMQYSNSYSPTLSNGQVNPNTGYKNSTVFTFSVNYVDADNNFPTFINVTINSNTYPMKKQNPSDINYMDGCMYTFNTILLDSDSYTYSFTCSDGGTTVSDGPYSGPIVEEEPILPDDFDLSSDADNPDNDGNFNLFWTESKGAVNYSVYQYSSYINEINNSLILIEEGFTNRSIALNGYEDGSYFFTIVAHNKFGDTLSNCFEIVVIKNKTGKISGFNILFLIGFISIVMLTIIIKKDKTTK